MVEKYMSEVKVELRDPIDKTKKLNYYIVPNDTQLAKDWVDALKIELSRNAELEKNYCWHGWPKTQRSLQYLANELCKHTTRVNNFNETDIWQSAGLKPYPLRTNYTVDDIMIPFTGINEEGKRGGGPNHDVMNIVHNYFEHLQGTVENLSLYYKLATPEVKYSIRQINNLCHEIETLCLSLRKAYYQPEWVRPSQITTFLNAHRYNLTQEHRQGFLTNGYNRKFGHVYMHWTQIGKTLMEVFRDEGAPTLDQATCDAITHLQYYSGEFDIEWGSDVVYGIHDFYTNEIDAFRNWLTQNNFDYNDPNLSLGYLELGHIDLQRSFGTTDVAKIWDIMSDNLDIYSIDVDGAKAVYDYSWADEDYEQRQINYLLPGYNSYV
jgi:hypothetical protein